MNNDKVDTFIRKLKTIGKLEPTEKIVIEEKTITVVDFNSYNIERVKKKFFFETRFTSCKKLTDLYNEIEEFSQTLMINPPPYWAEDDILITLKRLNTDMVQSCKGIKNLILTYNDNKSIKAELETITERIGIVTSKMETYLTTHKAGSKPITYQQHQAQNNNNKNIQLSTSPIMPIAIRSPSIVYNDNNQMQYTMPQPLVVVTSESSIPQVYTNPLSQKNEKPLLVNNIPEESDSDEPPMGGLFDD
jgi:hypothetical protein